MIQKVLIQRQDLLALTPETKRKDHANRPVESRGSRSIYVLKDPFMGNVAVSTIGVFDVLVWITDLNSQPSVGPC